jgi:hypothetical protein
VIGWVYGLSFGWLILVVLGLALGVAAVIWVLISVIAVGGRAQVLAALSPGMLPPLGIVFALVVGFLAAGVWSNASDARTAVNREASALRTRICWSPSSRRRTPHGCACCFAGRLRARSIPSGRRWRIAG